MKSFNSLVGIGSSSEKIIFLSHFFSHPATKAADLFSWHESKMSTMLSSMDDVCSAVVGPTQVCGLSLVALDLIDFRYVAVCKLIDYVYTENSPLILSL